VLCQKARIYSRIHPGVTSYLTEQTDGDIEDILIPAWIAAVPEREYRFVSSRRGVNILMDNSAIVKLRSRQSRRVHGDPPFRGPSGVGYIGHDEIAQDTRADVPKISMGMQRGANVLFYTTDYTTTPKPNWFMAYAKSFGVAAIGKRVQISRDKNTVAFYGRTKDNPYNDNLDEKMRSEGLSESEALQELEGWFVSLEGLCWPSFQDTLWPNGNRYDAGFQKGRPWILGVDHGGVDGAWGVFQYMPSRPHFEGGVLVLMAEYTPGAPAYRVLPEIKKRFGTPSKIFTGADHKTPGNTGFSAEQLFVSHGWSGDNGVDVQRITQGTADKEQQGRVLAGLLLNTLGQRRFCVSSKLESYYAGPTRGVLDVLTSDTWPEAGGNEYFRKEKSKMIFHEDSRDMLLYTVTGLHPPQWAEYTRWAA